MRGGSANQTAPRLRGPRRESGKPEASRRAHREPSTRSADRGRASCRCLACGPARENQDNAVSSIDQLPGRGLVVGPPAAVSGHVADEGVAAAALVGEVGQRMGGDVPFDVGVERLDPCQSAIAPELEASSRSPRSPATSPAEYPPPHTLTASGHPGSRKRAIDRMLCAALGSTRRSGRLADQFKALLGRGRTLSRAATASEPRSGHSASPTARRAAAASQWSAGERPSRPRRSRPWRSRP